MIGVPAVQPLNPARWLFAPALACMAASLLFALPIKVLGLQLPEPIFAMAPAFAWAVIRPSILPPLLLVGLGLFQDMLWGAPLGLWPLCMLAVHAMGYVARRILSGQGFVAIGAWYAAACVAAFLLGAILMALATGEVPSLLGVAAQCGATMLLFPLAWRLIDRYENADVRFR